MPFYGGFTDIKFFVPLFLGYEDDPEISITMNIKIAKMSVNDFMIEGKMFTFHQFVI